MTTAANAACTPGFDATPNPPAGTTVTCVGVTQTFGPAGATYGTGNQTGITINVDAGALVSGPVGFSVHDASFNNSGQIAGVTTLITTGTAISAAAAVTVTNNAGASIISSNFNIDAGSINLVNSGSIAGGPGGTRTPTLAAIALRAATDATVVNNAGASITQGDFAIQSGGSVHVNNSGSIVVADRFVVPSASSTAISAQTSATVTNNAGGLISGRLFGIVANGGGSTIFNAGTISGGTAAIKFGGIGNLLTLAPGSAITGNVLGTGGDMLQLGGSGVATLDGPDRCGPEIFRLCGPQQDRRLDLDADRRECLHRPDQRQRRHAQRQRLARRSAVTVNSRRHAGRQRHRRQYHHQRGGTLAPGNSIGLLTVQGNLVFTAAATYMVEVSPANADRTNVTGTATLGGATVNASFAAGTYVTKQYTIVNATGGVIGTFNALVNTNLPGGFTSSLSYDANNAYLNLDTELHAARPAA